MEVVSENPSSNCCVLCCRSSGEQTERNDVVDLLMKLYNLWDAEFTKNTELDRVCQSFKNLTFCETCETLIESGIEFKQKLAVVKEEISNHVEGHAFDAEPKRNVLRKQLQMFIENFLMSSESKTKSAKNDQGGATTSSNYVTADHSDSGATDWTAFAEVHENNALIPQVEFFEYAESTKSRKKRQPKVKQVQIPVTREPLPTIATSSRRTRKRKLQSECINLEDDSDSEPLFMKLRRSGKKQKPDIEDVIASTSSLYNDYHSSGEESSNHELKSESTNTGTSQSQKKVISKTMKTTRSRKSVPLKSTLKNKRAESSGSVRASASRTKEASDPEFEEEDEDECDDTLDTLNSTEDSGGMTKKKLKTISKSRTYKCFLCPEKFCSGISLKLHLRLSHKQGNETPDTRFRCPHCQNEFLMSAFDDLKAKDQCLCEHFGNKTIAVTGAGKCCDQSTFEKFSDFHLRRCQGLWYLKPEPDNIKEDCILCEEKYPLDFEYYLHLQSHYEPEFSKGEFCPLCPWRDGRCRAHVTRFHHLLTYSVHRYFCRACDTIYMPLNPELESGRFVLQEYGHFKSFALEHAKCQTSPKPRQTEFKCKWCPKVHKNPKDLIHHEATIHTKNLSVSCPTCDRKFVDKYDLGIHVKNHREKRYMCEQCPKIYLTTRSLNDHVAAAHVGQRNYMCDECGASFFSLSKLTVHKYIHIPTRDCACPECGKLFKSNKDVMCHVYQVHKLKRKAKPRQKPETNDPPQNTQNPNEFIQSFNFL